MSEVGEVGSLFEFTLEGKYRCRQCGRVFDTLEEHDRHLRVTHGKIMFEPILGMAL